jgi:hypothetical protein
VRAEPVQLDDISHQLFLKLLEKCGVIHEANLATGGLTAISSYGRALSNHEWRDLGAVDDEIEQYIESRGI